MDPFNIKKNYFQFECTKCGDCCTGDMQVELNLYDLYKMSRFLKFESTQTLFEKNYVKLVLNEHHVWLPQIQFKKKPYQFCPFLINEVDDKNYIQGLCQLHPNYKPLVCTLSPIGRIIDFQTGQDQYIFKEPTSKCPGLESHDNNSLQDILNENREQLEFQKRFFAILNNIKDNNISKESFIKKLYYLTIDQNFETEIQSIENIFNFKDH